MAKTARASCRPNRIPRPSIEALEDRQLLTTYSVTDLGVTPVGLNDSGQVAGVANAHAAIWQAGVVSDLGTLGGAASAAGAINRAGTVVGSATPGATSPPTAFRWRDGVMSDLGLGGDSSAVAVNDEGLIAANAGGRAVLWDEGATTDLGSLGPGGAEAADINNSGQVTGASWAGGYDGAIGLPSVHAFVWQDGVMTDLGTPAFTMSSYPRAINTAGQVVGSSTYYVNTGYGAAVVSHSFFYDGHTMQVLPVGGLQSWASDINDAGQIVGYADGRAYVFQDGVYTDLNTVVPPGQPVLTAAVAINNTGQIVASSIAGRAVLLTPVAAVRVIDDGDTGFSTTGLRPTVLSGQGYDGDARRLFAPSAMLLGARRFLAPFLATSTWTFRDVAPGTYRICATWAAGPDRAAVAPYTVLDNSTALATVPVNQRSAPAGFAAHGAAWNDLGTFTVSGGTLSVRLSNRTVGRVVADAVCIERVDGPAPAAAASATAGASATAAAGSIPTPPPLPVTAVLPLSPDRSLLVGGPSPEGLLN